MGVAVTGGLVGAFQVQQGVPGDFELGRRSQAHVGAQLLAGEVRPLGRRVILGPLGALLHVGDAHFAHGPQAQAQAGAEDEVVLGAVVGLVDGRLGLVQDRGPHEGGEVEAPAQVRAAADTVHLLHGAALGDGEAAGLELGVGLVEVVVEVGVTQVAVGLAKNVPGVPQVPVAPAEQVHGQALSAQLRGVDAQEFGDGGVGAGTKPRGVLLGHLDHGGAEGAEVRRPGTHGGKRCQQDHSGALLHGLPPLTTAAQEPAHTCRTGGNPSAAGFEIISCLDSGPN